MKKIMIWSMLMALVFSLAGCRRYTKVYDPEDYESIPTASSSDNGYELDIKPLLRNFSALMEKVGKDGFVVAGYPTGKREQFTSTNAQGYNKTGYTDTTIAVTDTYYGKPAKEIKVRELYFIDKDEHGNDVIIRSGKYKDRALLFYNDVQGLFFIYKESDGTYRLACDYILLMPDYREYNEEYVESLCDFYRGDVSAYVNEEGTWCRIPQEPIYIDDTGKKHYEMTGTTDTVLFWPKQEASNQEILEQFKENVLVRSATEFKIAIWPYGHKNHDNTGYYTRLPEMMAYSCYGVTELWYREEE